MATANIKAALICVQTAQQSDVYTKCQVRKNVTRHIWQRFVDMDEDVRHTPLYRDIYKLRQQKKLSVCLPMQKKSTVCAIRNTEAWLRVNQLGEA